MAENNKGNGRSFHTYKSDNRDKIAMKKKTTKTINGFIREKNARRNRAREESLIL